MLQQSHVFAADSASRRTFKICKGCCRYHRTDLGTAEDLAVLAKLLACSEETLINEKDRAEKIKPLDPLTGRPATENTISTFLSKIDDFDLNEYIKAIHFDEMKVPTVPFQIPSSRTCFGPEGNDGS